MSVHHRVAGTEAVLSAQGTVTPHEVADALDAVLPHLPPRGHVLLDLSGVEAVESPAGEVRELSTRHAVASRHGKPFRFAIVAPADVLYGLSRMYQTLTSGLFFEVGVFRSLPEARDWLNEG